MKKAALVLYGCVSYFVGPVASFHQIVLECDDFRRMDDGEWTREVAKGSSLAGRPAWTRAFLVR